jgi:hypothetical protein
MTHIRDDQCFITGKPGVGYFCESFDINHGFSRITYGLVLCGFTTTAGIF